MNQTKNWIEAINLTLAVPEDGAKLYDLLKAVKTSSALRKDPPVKVSLYRNTTARTNWIFHFLRDSAVNHPGKTKIGKNVAGIIGKLGHVEHAVWKKVKNSIDN